MREQEADDITNIERVLDSTIHKLRSLLDLATFVLRSGFVEVATRHATKLQGGKIRDLLYPQTKASDILEEAVATFDTATDSESPIY